MKDISKHKIFWLNMPGYKGETYNPIIGCSRVSAGCKNCYAEKMSGRLANIPSTHESYSKVVRWGQSKTTDMYTGLHKWNGKTYLIEPSLEKPLHWKKPRMIFVCSMSDLFHENNPFEWIDEVFHVIEKCPQHLFLLLTKRPETMLRYFEYCLADQQRSVNELMISKNIWIGVTAENQEQANKRIPILLQIPAAKRFVSVEPMLGPVDLGKYYFTLSDGTYLFRGVPLESRTKLIHLLDQIIVGGESGHNARPMHPDWVRSIRDQCKEANVPFFFKQGSQANWSNFKNAELDGQYYKEFPI